MKYYLIAGEASGDLHGSNLIKELKKIDKAAQYRAWGGDKMQALGIPLVKHHKDLAFMGFVEVIKNLPTILKNLKFCKHDILQYNPDALILIDYPGFNLRLVKWAKERGYKIIYYISPQVWAWKESRVNLIKKYVDKMIVILPFEKEFYKKHGYDVEYVGHPLVSIVEDQKQQKELQVTNYQLPEASVLQPQTESTYELPNIIALLPGSRKQEILKKLPIMLATTVHFPEYNFIIAMAPGISDDFYYQFLLSYKNVSISNQTYSVLKLSKAAVVTSGTATLETALFEIPEIVCYKASNLSYQIGKRLIKLKYISLVNLIMDKEVVKELIQNDLTVENISQELDQLLTNESRQQQIKRDYKELINLLSEGGDASANTAKIIYQYLN